MKNLIVLGLAAFCLAASAVDEQHPPKEQLEALENLLSKSPLQEVQHEPEDSGEETRSIPKSISQLANELKNKCKCEATTCNCCVKLKLVENTVCLTAKHLVEEKAVQIVFKIDEKELMNEKFTTERNDLKCGTVPFASFLKFCFIQQSEEEEDHSITSCSSVDFRVGEKVGAVLQFRCLEIKNGTATFSGGFKEVEDENALVVKVKNPFRAALTLYRRALGLE